MAYANQAIERVGDPEGPSLYFRFDSVLGFNSTLTLCNILGRVNLVQPHELDEAETASGADPAPLMIGPHEFVNKQ